VDTLTVKLKLKHAARLGACGGEAYLDGLPHRAPTMWNFDYYLPKLQELRHRRWLLAKAPEIAAYAHSPEVTSEQTLRRLQELVDATRRSDTRSRPRLKVRRFTELIEYQPPADVCLIGDNEIRIGQEGMHIIAGPGSSGKSLLCATIALAGALGEGLWMGRKIHRKFRTLIIQAENGPGRLKREVMEMARRHQIETPDDYIAFTDPPEGGLAFHDAGFRAELAEQIQRLQPDLVIIDPWSHVMAKDESFEVMEKLAQIRTAIGGGERAPGILIVAHTKKPRSEDMRLGRGLVHQVSGSVALCNTARAVWVLLPWSDEPADTRVLWTCCKLNDGEMYSASVWHRQFGTFFVHDPNTDPTTWGREEGEDPDYQIDETIMLKLLPPGRRAMKRILVPELVALGYGSSTAYRKLNPKGEFRGRLIEHEDGMLEWKGG
jgi:hypothetical protein